VYLVSLLLLLSAVSKIGIAGVDVSGRMVNFPMAKGRLSDLAPSPQLDFAQFQKELFEYIDPSSLPESIGGTCQCSHPDGCAFSDKGPWEQSTPPTPQPQPTTPTAQASQEVEAHN
jgi:hypothetical protein